MQENKVQITRIRPATAWVPLTLPDLSQYRDLFYFLVIRELKSRYRQSAFGPLWFLLVPLIRVGVYTAVFGMMLDVTSENIPYPLFAFAALLPWQYFATTTQKTAGSLVMNLHIISKVYFPRLLIPFSACAIGLVDFALAMLVFAVMMGIYGQMPPLHALWGVPLYTGMAMAFSLGVGLWLATLAVKFRDVIMGLTQILQFVFFASPIVYSIEKVPVEWHGLPLRAIYRLNPITTVIEGFRWSFFPNAGNGPDTAFAISAVAVLLILIGGVLVFRRTERSIVDLI